MFSYRIAFAAPCYLAILAALPVLWIFSYRRLAGLGGARRIVALALRTFVVALLATAVAEPQIVRISDRLTVIYLLDQSLSIPAAKRKSMIEYVNAEVRKHRGTNDRAGAIVFGGDAAIEAPPRGDNLQLAAAIESPIDPEHTNIAAAMKLAHAVLPEDAGKRVVVVTDGNQNQGDAIEQARAMAASGIGIDVVPVRYRSRAGVAVERMVLPGDVRRGQPFDVRVVLSNHCDPKPGDAGAVHGRLVLSQVVDDRPVVVSDEAVTLPPGKKVFTIRQQIDAPNFYTYEARIMPDHPEDDALPQSHRATAFTHVRGKGQVLLIEDAEHLGEHDWLVDRLRLQGLEVTVRTTASLFSGLADLQPYDTVVLANVPRATDEQFSFTDEQIDMLARNTQQLGAGLVMLGGPNSFGAGGWIGTELEKAMPVDFQVHNPEVVPRGALMMVIDKSGSMAGTKIAACKAAAIAAANALGPHDYVGVVAFDVDAYWIVPLQEVGDGKSVVQRIQRLNGDGGTNMKPGMLAGYEALTGVGVPVKHMIVLTDGITEGTGYPELAARMRRENITVSCLAVGEDAAKELMHDIAAASGGKSYNVKSPRAIPRIFQHEAMRVSRPLICESDTGMTLQSGSAHEMTAGIGPLPPITGYVLTNRKDNALAEVALLAPKPAAAENRTILAGWTYGLGRAVAFTTDAGARWTRAWPSQAVYDKLFGQIVRWSMRPAGESGKFTTTFEPRDGRMQIVVNALDKNDEILDFLTMTGTVVGPDLKKPIAVDIQQAGPGRYVGTFPAREAGSYFVTIDTGRSTAPIRAGATVPCSDEFLDRVANDTLLRQLAGTVPKGGSAGKLIEDSDQADSLKEWLTVDTFRHDLPTVRSMREIWHWMLLLASCLFLGDVFVRRIDVHLGWAPPLIARCRDWALRRQPQPTQPQYIERLRSRKAVVAGQLEQLRAVMRFEASADAHVHAETATDLMTRTTAASNSAIETSPSPEQPSEQESYTKRLLRAKTKAMEDRPTAP
jgi:Mg-chelatase subunit ChlD